MNSTILGIIALFGVQIILAGLSALIYSRMRSKADSTVAAMVPWGIEVKAAVGTANAAKSAVDMIELQHYKNLRSLFEDQALQIAQLKADKGELLKKIESLETKVLTLQRLDRKDRAREAPIAREPWSSPAGEKMEDDAARLDAILHAEGIPLNATNGAKPQPNRRPGFGEPAH